MGTELILTHTQGWAQLKREPRRMRSLEIWYERRPISQWASFPLVKGSQLLLPTPTSLCSYNWPDHHRGRWVGSFPGLLWGVWTGRACHQNTSKDSSVPRARAGHTRRLQTGPCPRHSWRELTAECLEGRGSQSLNGKEWFLWNKSKAVSSSRNVWLQLSMVNQDTPQPDTLRRPVNKHCTVT